MCIFGRTYTAIATRTCQRKTSFYLASSSPYLMMLRDTRAASHAKLRPHNSTDINKQCPKISSNSQLHILRFNPCLHMGSALSLNMQEEDFLLLRLSYSWATHSPQSPKSFSFVIYPVLPGPFTSPRNSEVGMPTPLLRAEHSSPLAANPHE